MKVLIIACGFSWSDVGGAQKICAQLSNALVDRNFQVSILYENKRNTDFFYPLSPQIQLYDLLKVCNYSITGCSFWWERIIRELLKGIRKNWADYWSFCCGCRKARNDSFKSLLDKIKPDIIVSFVPRATTAILPVSEQIPIVSMLHSDPEVLKNTPKEILQALKAVQNQVLLPEMKARFLKYIPGAHVAIIPNAVVQWNFIADLGKKKKRYVIINVGRLSIHKRQDLLIDSFALLANKFSEWDLELWGDDDGQGKFLYDKIREYHLEKRIFIRGATKNIAEIYRHGDLFALTSPKEGFCLAMAEAMSAGIPVVAYRHCNAANFLIEDNITGKLSDDGIEAFAKCLGILMENQKKRIAMGIAARQSMRKYKPDNIWNQWISLLKQTYKQGNVN